MSKIQYVTGNALEPLGGGYRIIAHVCNDIGAWGAGFTKAITEKWPEPERDYRKWHQGQGTINEFRLGAIQFCFVEENLLAICNMIAMRGVRGRGNRFPLRYYALAECLHELGKIAKRWEASIHMPRIGCGLAGGEWSKVEPLILDELCDRGISVTVYDLP